MLEVSIERIENRLDRLLLLLDTGSSPSVRNTAAKQLAQLAVKSVISDVTIVEDDVKTGSTRQQISSNDSQAWAELLAVVARVSYLFFFYCILRIILLDNTVSAFQIVRITHRCIQRAVSNFLSRPFLEPNLRTRC